MTADHAGQTGGEREHVGGDVCEAWGCDEPGTVYVRPVPVPGQPDARGRIGCDCGAGLSSCAPGCACDSCDRMRGRAGQAARESHTAAATGGSSVGLAAREEFTPAPQNVKSGPENSRGREQAAREAAVEAVALELWRRYPQTERTALRNARAILADKDVYAALLAALSATPGQEPLHEWPCPNCGATTRARMADQDDDHGDCFEVCQGHPR